MQQQPQAAAAVQYVVNRKTSGVAIFGFILSLLGFCCLPIIGPLLGILFGIIAIVKISGSSGLLGGKGLAIFAILIGIVGVAYIPAAIIGGHYYCMEAAKEPLGKVDALFKAIDRGDDKAAYAMLSKEVQDKLPLIAFEKAMQQYRSKNGIYKGYSAELWDGNFAFAFNIENKTKAIATMYITVKYSKTGETKRGIGLQKEGGRWKIMFVSGLTDERK